MCGRGFFFAGNVYDPIYFCKLFSLTLVFSVPIFWSVNRIPQFGEDSCTFLFVQVQNLNATATDFSHIPN